MASTFAERTKELEADVGDGDLVIGAVVEQPYAAAQHNRKYYKHPRGGMPGYLEVPFAAQRTEMLRRIAETVVLPDGSHLIGTAVEISEMFDDMVARFAPVRQDFLQESTYSYVLDNGRPVYWSSPRKPRRFDKQ